MLRLQQDLDEDDPTQTERIEQLFEKQDKEELEKLSNTLPKKINKHRQNARGRKQTELQRNQKIKDTIKKAARTIVNVHFVFKYKISSNDITTSSGKRDVFDAVMDEIQDDRKLTPQEITSIKSYTDDTHVIKSLDRL